jgi:hypothetical protein
MLPLSLIKTEVENLKVNFPPISKISLMEEIIKKLKK